jgi:hypothetical protein
MRSPGFVAFVTNATPPPTEALTQLIATETTGIDPSFVATAVGCMYGKLLELAQFI